MTKMEKPLLVSLTVGLCVRVGLMLYGLWQDSTMRVQYTDVDYLVFTDAAAFVSKGMSPYSRATYRYSPLLAWLLLPNIYITQLFGKTLFIIFDIFIGYIIFHILRQQNCSVKTSVTCAQLWLFNPLPMTVSSRGNAESVIASLVLATLYCLNKKLIISAAVLYALSVHLKIYPVTYALPIYLMLDSDYSGIKGVKKWKINVLTIPVEAWPNKNRLKFIAVSAATFIGLTVFCYLLYGDKFLQETYFYHVTRRDIRHNFSPYFYMLYLTDQMRHAWILAIVAFVPQLILLVIISLTYHSDLPMCCFLHTFVFVTFNKVCTSQYYLWYLSLLPLLVPYLHMSWRKGVFLLVVWFAGQGIWLTPAYYLEFEGINTFMWIWVAGLVFFAINIYIICNIINSYHRQSLTKHKKAEVNIPYLTDLMLSFWNKGLATNNCS